MTETQTTFTPVTNIEDTLKEVFLKVADVNNGDKVKIVKDKDRPIVWSEIVDFSGKDQPADPKPIYKCFVKKGAYIVEMGLNGMSRKTIFNKVKEDLAKLEGMTATLIVVDKGAFTHFFIGTLE